jgi:hypothetical protein
VLGARRKTGRLALTILLDIVVVDWRGLAGVLVTVVIAETGILVPGDSK